MSSKYHFTTKNQELVLKAALFENNEAIKAWEKWETSNNLEGHHDDVFRLLPLLYHNLKKNNVDHPFMKRLKGVYKMFWYKNKQLIHENIIMLKELRSLGIESLLFKGAPIAILHYKNIGLRPMNDIDVLIKKSDLKKTVKFLTDQGWTPRLNTLEDELKYNNGAGFTDTNGNEFDIHWHPFVESIWEENHLDFWEKSVPIQLSDFETRAFCAADLLLHTIIHGIKWNLEPPVRWIADSFYLINYSGEQIEWERFIYLIKKYSLAMKIQKSLEYITDVFQVNIPPNVIKEIDRIKISKADRIEYEYILNDPSKNHSEKIFGNFIYHLISYRDVVGKELSLKKILMFPDYLRYRYGSSNLLSFTFVFIKLFLKKIVMNFLSAVFGKKIWTKN